jgi:hypothetical protein
MVLSHIKKIDFIKISLIAIHIHSYTPYLIKPEYVISGSLEDPRVQSIAELAPFKIFVLMYPVQLGFKIMFNALLLCQINNEFNVSIVVVSYQLLLIMTYFNEFPYEEVVKTANLIWLAISLFMTTIMQIFFTKWMEEHFYKSDFK